MSMMAEQQHVSYGAEMDINNVDQDQPRPTPPPTRNRQSLSCAVCRKSKLKCDRNRPCETCVKRGHTDDCTYEISQPLPRKKRKTAPNAQDAQDRLRSLEALVMQMINPNDAPQAAQSLAEGSVSNASHTPSEGHMTVLGKELRYVGSTHWSAILDNINELKTVIVSEDISDDGDSGKADVLDPDTLFLFSAPRPPSLEKVLEALPPRSQVDRLLSIYFTASYLVLPILHKHQFQRQYESFWRDPLATPLLWISILFSILCTSMTVSLNNPSNLSSQETDQIRRREFLTASAQCLILGDYGKPQKYSLEALMLFGHTKYIAVLDPSREVALLLPMGVRFAYELGYHRDPDHFPHISVFDGEMRRRVWAMCRQTDLLQAIQLGLPTYISDDSYDTKPFRNLEDSDFDENSIELPSSRPETEPTRNLQFLVKYRQISAFTKAFRTAISLKPISPETVLELDEEVRAAQRRIPLALQFRPIAQSFADSASVIMARLDCELLYRRTLCALHRKSMISGNAYSRDVCTESAISILTSLIDLRRELQPGGQLPADQYFQTSYTMHIFLVGAMILCLSLAQRRKASTHTNPLDHAQIHFELELIQQAHASCDAVSGQSKEAKRVANVLSSMLSSLRQSLYQDDHRGDPQGLTAPAPTTAPFTQPYVLPPEQFNLHHDPFESLSAIPEDIDWAYLDQYCLDTNPSAYIFNDLDPSLAAPIRVEAYKPDTYASTL